MSTIDGKPIDTLVNGVYTRKADLRLEAQLTTDAGGSVSGIVGSNNAKIFRVQPRVERGGYPVITDWTGATLAGGATVVAGASDNLYPVNGSGKIVGNSGTTCSVYKAVSVPWAAAKKIKTCVFRARCVASSPRPLQLRLYNTGLTKYLNALFAVPNDGLWHTFSVDEFTLAPGSGFVVGTDDIAFVQFREERSALGQTAAMATNGSEYIQIGKVWFERGTRAKFMFTFDDSQVGLITPNTDYPTGYPDTGVTARDILGYYGYVGTAYCIPDYFGQSGYETVATLRLLESEGWDIATHSQASETGQIGNSTHGLRTLGTFGLGPFNIASVATNVLTITAHPFTSGSKVTVSGTVIPAGLTAGSVYWTRNLSANTVSLHPTKLDANNNTNIITVSDAGTAAYLKWYDAVGPEAVLTTVTADSAAMRGYGFYAWDHYALPQGGFDAEVLRELQKVGLKTVRGVEAVSPYIIGISKGGTGANLPAYNFLQAPVHIPACIDLLTIGYSTAITYIDRAIYCGGTTGIYLHKLTGAGATLLDQIATYVKSKERDGLIDIVTVSEWYDDTHRLTQE